MLSVTEEFKLPNIETILQSKIRTFNLSNLSQYSMTCIMCVHVYDID